MTTPLCPHCLAPLKRRSTNGVSHEFCPSCRLLRLDSGKWQDLAEAASLAVDRKGPSTQLTREESQEYARRLLQLDNAKRSASEVAGFQPVQSKSTLKSALALMGLPVEYEEDDFAESPWATWLLIALCVLVGVWTFGNEESAIARFAFRAGEPFSREIYKAVTSFFIHGGIIHLASNMYYLWVFGDNVEDNLGKFRYLLLVLFAVLAGDVCFALFDLRAHQISLIGASGGISGILAFYIIRFPKRRMLVNIWFRHFTVRVWIFGIFYFLLQDVIGAFSPASSGNQVSHLAHLGGALVGAAAGFLLEDDGRSQD